MCGGDSLKELKERLDCLEARLTIESEGTNIIVFMILFIISGLFYLTVLTNEHSLFNDMVFIIILSFLLFGTYLSSRRLLKAMKKESLVCRKPRKKVMNDG